MNRREVFDLISAERGRQSKLWGVQWEPGVISPYLKLAILTEEVGEIANAVIESHGGESAVLKEELVQTAAVAVAWLESLQGE